MKPTPRCRAGSLRARLPRHWLKAVCLGLLFNAANAAPVQISGAGSHSQNFDTLPVSGSIPWVDDSTLPGWYSQRSGSGADLVAGTGSSDDGGLYSYGSAASGERALGAVASGTVGAFAHGLSLQNTSENAYTINSLAYSGEQWRKSGATTPQIVTLWYQISATPITNLTPTSDANWTALPTGDFGSPTNTTGAGPLDGNDSANRLAVSINSNISVPAGSYIMIRWKDPDHTGTDHGLAIDDVSLSWIQSPPITLSASPATFAENAGSAASTGTISIPSPLAVDLVVSLISGDPTEAAVPASVTILAGNLSATFPIEAVNDAIVDGPQSVLLTASAGGFVSGSTSVEVTDDGEPPPPATLSPGAIAFTGFNADSNDDLAFVTLVPIAETDTIFFTDRSWNGLAMGVDGAFTNSEGTLTWAAPAGGVAAGTVITLNALTSSGRNASHGQIVSSAGAFNLGGEDETVYAYQGSASIPTGFLAVIANHTGDSTTNTGLNSTHIIQLPADVDIAAYTGPRAGQPGFAAYLALIGNTATNWVTENGTNDQSSNGIAPDVPFDTTIFTLLGASGYTNWAIGQVAGQGAGADYDSDGIDNGTEYFMGTAGNVFTPNPPIIGGTVTWPRAAGTSVSSFKVEVSNNLTTWEDAALNYSANLSIGASSVAFTLPGGPGKFFVRLSVTP